MRNPQYSNAMLFVYDVKPVLEALEPAIIEMIEFQSFLTHMREEDLIDLWFKVTIYDFQHVGVLGYTKSHMPCEIINAFRATGTAIGLLYRELYLPPTIAGCMVLLKRERHTLYMVAYDPHQLRNLDRTVALSPSRL